ncbi:L-arabinose transport system permease protein AraQ [Blautia producta]|uniref:L-arabinose transport system permease protein AraQ n=1 Tax=Blautia producta TaxID=33035 RepID=A0A4P6M081_9FIRM|nr:carbohydrate ABC transporter permease [Blautia producta]QBE96647.1 L-arabinose transport system permease protein AraQ [Blautia producta]
MKGKRVSTIICYIMIILLVVISLLPILWMVSTAFKLKIQAFAKPPVWIPRPVTFENFTRVYEALPFLNYFMNSLFVTAVVVVGQLAFGILAAYGFSRLRFPGRDAMFFLLLSGLMIPQIVQMIPQYLIIQKLNWIDTYSAMIIPQVFSNVLGIFLLRQFLMGIPRDFEEAAKIDGAGILKVFFSIMLPQVKPVMATVGVMSFLKAWNNFLWPLVVVNTPKKQVLTVGLQVLQGQFISDWSGIMAGATITMLPILLVYLFAQKYFVQSIYMTGIK